MNGKNPEISALWIIHKTVLINFLGGNTMEHRKRTCFYKKPIITMILIISMFWVGCGGQADNSLDGTWEINNESLKENHIDNADYQLIARTLVFSGELITITTTVDYRDDYIVSMSDEELLARDDEVEIELIERGDDYVIVRWTATANFSLTDDETGLAIDGEEYIAPFSRTGKNTILLDEAEYTRTN